MKNLNTLILAASILLLSGCATQHLNTVKTVGKNNKIVVVDSNTKTERIITLPNNNKTKEALKYTKEGDSIKVCSNKYNASKVLDKAKLTFNEDSICARQQQETFQSSSSLLSGYAIKHINTIKKIGKNNEVLVVDSDTKVERILSLPKTADMKEILKHTKEGDVVEVCNKKYDATLLINDGEMEFNKDSIYARQQQALFQNALKKNFQKVR